MLSDITRVLRLLSNYKRKLKNYWREKSKCTIKLIKTEPPSYNLHFDEELIFFNKQLCSCFFPHDYFSMKAYLSVITFITFLSLFIYFGNDINSFLGQKLHRWRTGTNETNVSLIAEVVMLTEAMGPLAPISLAVCHCIAIISNYFNFA